MPKILKLQKVGDGIGIVLDVDFLVENQSIQVLDDFEILRLRRESEEAGAQDERERLNAEERQKEMHSEIVKELRAARQFLATHRHELDLAAGDIDEFLSKGMDLDEQDI
jgi:hypothetical protein